MPCSVPPLKLRQLAAARRYQRGQRRQEADATAEPVAGAEVGVEADAEVDAEAADDPSLAATGRGAPVPKSEVDGDGWRRRLEWVEVRRCDVEKYFSVPESEEALAAGRVGGTQHLGRRQGLRAARGRMLQLQAHLGEAMQDVEERSKACVLEAAVAVEAPLAARLLHRHLGQASLSCLACREAEEAAAAASAAAPPRHPSPHKQAKQFAAAVSAASRAPGDDLLGEHTAGGRRFLCIERVLEARQRRMPGGAPVRHAEAREPANRAPLEALNWESNRQPEAVPAAAGAVHAPLSPATSPAPAAGHPGKRKHCAPSPPPSEASPGATCWEEELLEEGAVTVQAVWRGVLARREYRHRRACRQAAKAYRRRRGQQALRAWRQVLQRRRLMRGMVNDLFVRYGKRAHRHIGTEFDGEAILHREGKAAYADAFRKHRAAATAFLRWLAAATQAAGAAGRDDSAGTALERSRRALTAAAARSPSSARPRRGRPPPPEGSPLRSSARRQDGDGTGQVASFSQHIFRVMHGGGRRVIDSSHSDSTSDDDDDASTSISGSGGSETD